MWLRFVLFIACAFFYGCASAPSIDISRLEAARVSLAKVKLPKNIASLTSEEAALRTDDITKEQDEALNEAFANMLEVCKSSLSGFEQRAENLKKWKIGIATAGALVGGIAVPALTTASAAGNAVWISGLGGFSGVTNIAQQTMDSEMLTSEYMLTIRSQILNDWKSATIDYFDPQKEYKDRKLAIQRGIVACTMYAITVPDGNVTNGTSETD